MRATVRSKSGKHIYTGRTIVQSIHVYDNVHLSMLRFHHARGCPALPRTWQGAPQLMSTAHKCTLSMSRGQGWLHHRQPLSI